MKKVFEKNDLLKLAGIFVVITIIFSWLIPTAYFNKGVLYGATDVFKWDWNMASRAPVGYFDWSVYGFVGVSYFVTNVIFLFVIAGFYKLLGNTAVYQNMTDKIASKLKGKEKVFIAVITLIFAALAGVIIDQFILLLFVPFIITILNKMGVNKYSALATTFGGILVGTLGSTYSTKISGNIINTSYGIAGVKIGFELLPTIIVFVIAYALLTYFSIAYLKKDKEPVKDIFKSDISDNKNIAKVSTLPLAISLIILAITVIIASIPWSSSFEIDTFVNLAKEITEFDGFFGTTIFASILGKSFLEFGSVDLLTITGYIFVILLIIKVIYHISMDKILESFGEGFKTISSAIILFVVIYSVMVLNYYYSTFPYIVNAILGLSKNFITLFISGAISTIFTVDFQYNVIFIGNVFATMKDANVAALILQFSYGVLSFIAPTSCILMLGLSMLDIKFKDYFKFIWKFLLILLIIVLIILAILMYL